MRVAVHRPGRGQGAGFTLIELLVAMTILMIIVMIVAQIFQQARQVWDTGTRRADMNMKGRAVVDYIAQDLAMAIGGPGHPFLPPNGSDNKASFYILGDATNGFKAARQVTYAYDGTTITRDTKPMCDVVQSLDFFSEPDPSGKPNMLPLYVDVTVSVSDGGSPPTNKVFTSRAFMINRQRYNMD